LANQPLLGRKGTGEPAAGDIEILIRAAIADVEERFVIPVKHAITHEKTLEICLENGPKEITGNEIRVLNRRLDGVEVEDRICALAGND
jgi:hypothetical protein